MFPPGVNKEAFFDEQKVFIIYLMGSIPDFQEWSLHLSYKKKMNEIKNLKDIDIDETDIEVAKINGESIEALKKKRLKQKKKRMIQEVNKEFGIKDEQIEENKDIKKDLPKEKTELGTQQLWEMLEGRGLVKKNG